MKSAPMLWGQWYDFQNIFAQKKEKQNGVFYTKHRFLCKKIISYD
jgi:hypothetical protein